MSIELNGLTMVAVAGATTVLGTTKGGWIHASQRPSYEAKTPAFYIMASPLTERQVTDALPWKRRRERYCDAIAHLS